MIELHGQIKPQRLHGRINVVASDGNTGGPLQSKTVYPSHSQQIIAPDDDYYGLASVKVEPVPRLPAFSLGVAADDAISAVTTPLLEFGDVSVTAEDYEVPKTHALYNGVRLPKIPEDVLAQYPYAWIRKDDDNSRYDLAFATGGWYYKSGLYRSVSENAPRYVLNFDDVATANEWPYFGEDGNWWTITDTRAVLWSNHDIPNGSATATDIYFKATEPVPTD